MRLILWKKVSVKKLWKKFINFQDFYVLSCSIQFGFSVYRIKAHTFHIHTYFYHLQTHFALFGHQLELNFDEERKKQPKTITAKHWFFLFAFFLMYTIFFPTWSDWTTCISFCLNIWFGVVFISFCSSFSL